MKYIFIKKSKEIHDDFYDYSLVEYKNARTKVKIICPIHGVFEKSPDNHINRKQGCPKCKNKYHYTNLEIINKMKEIHGDFYDYSLVVYINAKTKVKIICPIHGIFEQRCDHHINGVGCLKCFNLNKKDISYFIKISKEIHGDFYDYSLSEYKNNHTKIKIICPIHGIFEQTSINHINKKQGCPKCSGKYKNNEQFIEESININNFKYDYSLVDYKNNRTNVKLICLIHGIFEQSPNNHLSKNQGCPKCNESKGEKNIRVFLESQNIKFISQYKFKDCKDKRCLPFDFYLPDYNTCIEYDGKQHYEPVEYWGGLETFKKVQLRDNIKTKYCSNNNIKLLRISYNDDILLKMEKFKPGKLDKLL